MTEAHFVLTESGKVECDSGGSAVLTGAAKLTVGGSAVLRPAEIMGSEISGCTVPTDTQAKTVQCTKVTTATGGASKLTAGSTPVALVTLAVAGVGIHAPPTLASLSVTAGQEKLRAG